MSCRKGGIVVLQKKLLLSCVMLCFVLGVYFDVRGQAGNCNEQPEFRGNVLIIYNDPPPVTDQLGNNLQFSARAMQTFRAALSSDRSLISYPTHIGGVSVYDNICAMPKLENIGSVNILRVTQQGFENDLRAKFLNQGNNIDEQQFDQAIFAQLNAGGNPLAYWSQVYDLRFNHWAAWGDRLRADISSITPRDVELFGEYLKVGGSLYVQTVRGWVEPALRPEDHQLYGNRNTALAGVQGLIRTLTRDKDYDDRYNRVALNNDVSSFEFHQYNNFNCSPHNLNAMQSANGMIWGQPGLFPRNRVTHGRVLASEGSGSDNAFILGWGNEAMDPEIANGNLIVGYAITAWVPQRSSHEGSWTTTRVTCATFAIIQNLFTFMNAPMFNMRKDFVQEVMGDGDRGSCRIILTNFANYPVEGLVIKDTISHCLEFISGSAVPALSQAPQTLGDGRTELTWITTLPAGIGNTFEIKFDFHVRLNPPCN